MIPKVTAKYEQQNLDAARIILSNVEHYGEGSGAVLWARLVIQHARERTGPTAEGLLFANRPNGSDL